MVLTFCKVKHISAIDGGMIAEPILASSHRHIVTTIYMLCNFALWLH